MAQSFKKTATLEKKILDWIGLSDVLDLRCGSGQLGKLCLEKGLRYSGIDYSKVAVGMAGKITGRPECFRVANITSFKRIHPKGGVIVMLELLEHITEDLKVIEKISQGSDIIFSAPNYDHQSHVRFFKSIYFVRKRYGSLIHIDSTHTITLSKSGKKIFLIKGVRK